MRGPVCFFTVLPFSLFLYYMGIFHGEGTSPPCFVVLEHGSSYFWGNLSYIQVNLQMVLPLRARHLCECLIFWRKVELQTSKFSILFHLSTSHFQPLMWTCKLCWLFHLTRKIIQLFRCLKDFKVLQLEQRQRDIFEIIHLIDTKQSWCCFRITLRLVSQLCQSFLDPGLNWSLQHFFEAPLFHTLLEMLHQKNTLN